MRERIDQQRLATVIADLEAVAVVLNTSAASVAGTLVARRLWAERKRVENLIGNFQKDLSNL